jgi:hypothetical protein
VGFNPGRRINCAWERKNALAGRVLADYRTVTRRLVPRGETFSPNGMPPARTGGMPFLRTTETANSHLDNGPYAPAVALTPHLPPAVPPSSHPGLDTLARGLLDRTVRDFCYVLLDVALGRVGGDRIPGLTTRDQDQPLELGDEHPVLVVDARVHLDGAAVRL